MSAFCLVLSVLVGLDVLSVCLLVRRGREGCACTWSSLEEGLRRHVDGVES